MEGAKVTMSIYMQIMDAQKDVQMRLGEMHKRKLIQAVERTSEMWIQRRSLKKFWMWRATAQSCKRLYEMRREKLAKLQSLVKRMLVQRSPIGRQVAERTMAIRRDRFRKDTTIIMQKHIKGWLMDTYFSDMQHAARTFQFYLLKR